MIVDKNSKVSLCVQVRNMLVDCIRSGELPPGRRIPGERMLADSYGVSRGTAVEALKLLENDGYVERISTRGTFISQEAGARTSALKILYPFPEKSLSPQYLNYANYCAGSELYQGMLQGTLDFNMQITFQYFEDPADRNAAMKQLKAIRNFDGVVFTSHQLSLMRELVTEEGMPYVMVGTHNQEKGTPFISYKRLEGIKKTAQYVIKNGYRSVGLLRFYPDLPESREKIDLFTSVLLAGGVNIDKKWIFHLEDDKELAYKKLKNEMPHPKDGMPEIFFCESVSHPFAFFRVASECGLKIGSDVDVISHGGDTSFRGIMPSLTYLRIPYFEMGVAACRALNEKICGSAATQEHVLLPSEIIEGESTKGKRTK